MGDQDRREEQWKLRGARIWKVTVSFLELIKVFVNEFCKYEGLTKLDLF